MNQKDVVIDIRAMLDKAEPPITAECCIYRVPSDIRRLNEDAYTPMVVSIGPFHHHHPRLQNMQRHKLIYCKKFLGRDGATLDSLIGCVEEAEPSVRRCYSDILELTKEELVNMMLVDSVFIIELIYSVVVGEHDPLLLKPWLLARIQLDLFLLENQLPYSLLEKMFNRVFPSFNFLALTFKFFGDYNRSSLAIDDISIRHFTDLLRTFHLLTFRPSRTEMDGSDLEMHHRLHLPSATELLEAGVRFEVNTSNCLLDLRFSGGVLQIPKFRVDDWTEILFRNMTALEQCHYPDETYISDYVAVLDFLINTSRDVDALVQKRILLNWLGDNDSVANLYNSIWKNITHTTFNSHYLRLSQDLNAFCRDPWRKLRATLRRDYGNTPWQAAASIAGIVLLFLSLLQSVCSVLQVVQQYKAS